MLTCSSDLDDFKRTNDSVGHPVGDRVLQITAGRLVEIARTDDTVARLEGDEFLVITRAIGTASTTPWLSASGSSTRLPRRCDRRGASPDRLLFGVTIAARFADGDELIREADLAVYRAKSAGRGSVEVFDDAMRAEVDERSTDRTAPDCSIPR